MGEGVDELGSCVEACDITEKSEWNEDRERQFLVNFAALVQKNEADVKINTALNGYTAAIHNLLRNCICGNMSVDDGCNLVEKFIHWSPDLPSVIVDVLVALDMEFSVDTEHKQKFITLCKSLSKQIPIKLFKERYELDSIAELDVFPAKSFSSKCIKLKTRLYYKQNKFNLLREEIEGFSKLIVSVYSQSCLPDLDVGIANSKNLLLSFCGLFSLDPARVLDVVLDIFECNLENKKYFISLITDFIKEEEVIMEVLSFKYLMHFNENSTTRSLHQMVSCLINDGVIHFDEIYNQIEPHEDNQYKEIETKFEAAQKRSLTKTNGQEETKDYFEQNQKLGLCEVLISCGRWDLFTTVLNETNREFFMQQKPVAEATCKFIHYLIEPLYEKNNGLACMPKLHRANKMYEINESLASLSPISTWSQFSEIVLPIIFTVGPSIYHDASLVFKICYLLITAKDDERVDLERDTLRVLEKCLLPALSLSDAGCCIAEVIWDLLKKFDVSVRYCCYSNWKEFCQKCPAISKRRQTTVHAIKMVMKKISKENVKPMGRLLGKLSHSAPCDLANQVIFQIQMHDSLIAPIVESLKYLNNLSYDLLGYAVLDALRCDSLGRPKHDGNSPLPWFCNTANFCAALMKKYTVDISAILRYIVERLIEKDYIVIILLKELLHKMTGIEITDEMTDDQIDALGGGECLRGEAAYYVPLRSMKKSASRLKEALLKDHLLAPLAILVAQSKQNIIFDDEQDFHLKFLGKLYDECHDVLLQFGTFMTSSGPLEDVIESLPSLDSLVLDYQLTHEAGFFLSRQHMIHQAMTIAESSKSNEGKSDEPDCQMSTSMETEDEKPHPDTPVSGEEKLFPPENVPDDESWGTEGSFRIPAENAIMEGGNGGEWDADDEATWKLYKNEPSSHCNDRPIQLNTGIPSDIDYVEDDDDEDPEVTSDTAIDDASFDIADDSFANPDSVDKPEIKDLMSVEVKLENPEVKTEAIKDTKIDVKDIKEEPKIEDNKDDYIPVIAENQSHLLLECVLPSVLKIQELTSFVTDEVSPHAAAVFWTLTLYDIYVPVELYDKEIMKLKNAHSAGESGKESRSRKDQEKLSSLIDKLIQEKVAHLKHVELIRKHLEETKSSWFPTQTPRSAKNELINVLLHSCVLPRVLHSAIDALYSAKFILMLHQLKIEHFSTVLCYDRLLCDIKNLVALCSENEANRLGRFLCAVLTDLMRFHSDKEIYDAECANTPGFITKFRSTSEQTDSDKVDYENFRHLCHKWHYKLTKALICLLDSNEYVLRRNTIIVLKKILPKFPTLIKLAQCIERKIDKVKMEEKGVRQDLHILATSYWGQLVARNSLMLKEKDFHQIKESEEEQSGGAGGDGNSTEEFPLSKDEKSSPKTDKRRHSDSNKKSSDSSRSKSGGSADAKKPRKKHKSRSVSAEPEKHDKKGKIKRGDSPDLKKTRKKEKKTSKRKLHESPEATDKKHKVSSNSGSKSKRT